MAGWSDAWTAGAQDYDLLVVSYDPGSLNRPTHLVATVAAADSVVLTWVDNSPNEESFHLERRTLPGGRGGFEWR